MQHSANARVLVEIAVESVAGAIAAANAGADRIELCTSLAEGGLTPSLGLFDAVRAAVRVPVVTMVRPRRGDFLYDASELDVMRRDIVRLKDAGTNGVVTGVLLANGHVDAARLRELVSAAAPLPVTFHRAFDLCADPRAAIDALVAAGVSRVLTSGQSASALDGAAAIAAHVAAAGARLRVIAGAGVRGANVREIVARTGVTEVHLSAAASRASDMTFRRAGVPMGAAAAPDEYELRTTDGTAVNAVVRALAPRQGPDS